MRIVSLVAALTILGLSPAIAQKQRPANVILIVADDIGYGDLSCYGATKIRTPNLDRIAKSGTRFLDAHTTASVCTPTRYSLLTGEYAFRNPAASRILSGEAALSIRPGTTTLPGLFKSAGFSTAIVGKWHLGLGVSKPDFNAEVKPGPKEVGFDYSFILPATGDRTPCVYLENQRVVGYDPSDPIAVDYTKRIGGDPTGKDNPELLTNQRPLVGHNDTIINGVSRIGFMSGGNAARWKDEDMADTFAEKAVTFVRKHKMRPYFLLFTPHNIHVPRLPHKRFRGKSGLGLRGDSILELDDSVGKLLAELDRQKMFDGTTIIFTSDNGGVLNDGYADGTPEDQKGHTINGALRGYKGGLYEGGSRVPFIVKMRSKSLHGSTSSELISLVDLPSTFATYLGVGLPTGAAPDSVNVLAAFAGLQSSREHLLIQAAGGALALRSGRWKWIPRAGGQGELYDLETDIAEAKNLAKEMPEKVKEMSAMLENLRATRK